MKAIALISQARNGLIGAIPNVLGAAYDGHPSAKLDLSDVNQKVIDDSCCADADLMLRALRGSNDRMVDGKQGYPVDYTNEKSGTSGFRYLTASKKAACFRMGGGSTSYSQEGSETMGPDNRMWKSSKTEFDATLIKKIQCKSNFDLRIYECNGCDCSIKIEGHTKLQLVKVHTAHGLHPDSKDKACEPWFTYVDGMIRNQVSNVRREVIKATPNP